MRNIIILIVLGLTLGVSDLSANNPIQNESSFFEVSPGEILSSEYSPSEIVNVSSPLKLQIIPEAIAQIPSEGEPISFWVWVALASGILELVLYLIPTTQNISILNFLSNILSLLVGGNSARDKNGKKGVFKSKFN